jgi:hypothetical protein
MIRFCYMIHPRILGVYISIQRKSKRQAPFFDSFDGGRCRIRNIFNRFFLDLQRLILYFSIRLQQRGCCFFVFRFQVVI